jgi:hypothetical protein
VAVEEDVAASVSDRPNGSVAHTCATPDAPAAAAAYAEASSAFLLLRLPVALLARASSRAVVGSWGSAGNAYLNSAYALASSSAIAAAAEARRDAAAALASAGVKLR